MEVSPLVTVASLKEHTRKDLAEMAKKMGIASWHSLRKDQLVRALVRAARNSAQAPASRSRKTASADQRSSRVIESKSPTPVRSPKNSKASRSLRRAHEERERHKDLTTPPPTKSNGRHPVKKKTAAQKRAQAILKNGSPGKDRIVLLVRDSYWIQACWELTRPNIQRAKAAMAEHWHTGKPILRIYEIQAGATTNVSEKHVRDIEIHGGVTNWYIDVDNPPNSYRVDIGYLGDNGKMHVLARSGAVSTPAPGSSDALDENWTDVAEDCDRIFALSGGHSQEKPNGELHELFEERLRRPMGSPVVTRFGNGAEKTLMRERSFGFEVDAEMIIFGETKPNAYVTLAGEPVKLRDDGTFTVRLKMPDRRQVLPVVASSVDGVEVHTIVLAIERNTKVLEPYIRETGE